jgi:hypothetical protein
MKIFQLIIISLSVFFLFGCGNNEQNPQQAQTTNTNKDVTISADGVGAINSQTPFNIHQLTQAFPDYSVVEQLSYQKGSQTPVIRISKDGKALMTLNPDQDLKKIFSVTVKSNQIGNSLGHEIGQTYNQIYTYGETEECAPGVEDFSGKVLCFAPKTPNILYLFSGNWDGANNQLPPTEVLASWVLESIIWRPKSH